MCGAEQRVNAALDAEDRVPEQIERTTGAENGRAHQRRHIAGGQRAPPGVAARVEAYGAGGKEERVGGVAGVERAVPGREEGFELGDVGVRPAVELEAGGEPTAEQDGRPVEAQASNRGAWKSGGGGASGRALRDRHERLLVMWRAGPIRPSRRPPRGVGCAMDRDRPSAYALEARGERHWD